MTRFTVVWATDVQNDYLDGWIDADSATRYRLTAIAKSIDHLSAINLSVKTGAADVRSR